MYYTSHVRNVVLLGQSSSNLKYFNFNLIFIRYGEIVNINLVRDKKTGKSKGFCFICYEDQRSTILSVDNLNGIKVCFNISEVCSIQRLN